MPRPSLMLLLGLSLVSSACLSRPAARVEFGEGGLLVLSAAQDSTRLFRWEDGPGPGQLSLIWPEGRLIIPATLPLQGDEQGDLGVPLQAGFAGAGPAGPVPLGEGLMVIDESLTFSDGRLHWTVQEGEMDVRGTRIIYRRPWVGADQAPGAKLRDQRANLLMVAGLLLLIAVLLRRARQKTRRKA